MEFIKGSNNQSQTFNAIIVVIADIVNIIFVTNTDSKL